MRKILVALAALSLTACQTTGGDFADPNFSAGSPLENAQTRASQTLVVAWRAFDAVLTAVDALSDTSVLRPGTPRAVRVAGSIREARAALDAATNAVRVGNSASYSEALQRAHLALSSIRTVLGER